MCVRRGELAGRRAERQERVMGRGQPGAVLVVVMVEGRRSTTTTCVTSGAGDEEMATSLLIDDACSPSLFGDSAASLAAQLAHAFPLSPSPPSGRPLISLADSRLLSSHGGP